MRTMKRLRHLTVRLTPLSMMLSVSLAAHAGDQAPAAERPNILVILSDDHGYADCGFQGSTEIPTPHLDRLARAGLRCTSGYVSHSYCSPSRAGLLTGRNQMRFGHERNPCYDPGAPESQQEGLPTTETLLPAYLGKAGYVTGWIGKWHLGDGPKFRPENRGFQETFGFLGGGHHFIDWQVKPGAKSKDRWPPEYSSPILRKGKEVEVKEHLTLAQGHEAASFIQRNKGKPWFLYLAFNAPHAPHEPTQERLARFSHIKNKERRAYDAQVSLMDDAVGETLDALRASGQESRTLVFFLSDNGGPTFWGANNDPLHGGKGMTYEGGVRVPFVVSWPGHLPAGKDYDRPVSALDIFATSLACAGVPMPTDKPHDGVDLIPYLSGKDPASPHQRLFWRLTEKGKRRWGVRENDLKMVWQAREPEIFRSPYWSYCRDGLSESDWLKHAPEELYDLSTDLGERKDLSAQQPNAVSRLLRQLEEWDKLAAPLAFDNADGPDDGPHPKQVRRQHLKQGTAR